jgi:nitrite reductase (NADH) small subunit
MTLVDQTRAGTAPMGWVRVCALADLEVERGRAALLGGIQIALFLTHGGRVHAVSNFDPYSRANVISRGIVGSREDAPTVASPMYKQVFDLRTGACLDAQGKDPIALQVWPVTVSDGDVLVRWESS